MSHNKVKFLNLLDSYGISVMSWDVPQVIEHQIKIMDVNRACMPVVCHFLLPLSLCVHESKKDCFNQIRTVARD